MGIRDLLRKLGLRKKIESQLAQPPSSQIKQPSSQENGKAAEAFKRYHNNIDISEVVRKIGPFGIIKVNYDRKTIMVSEEIYKKMSEFNTKMGGLTILPYVNNVNKENIIEEVFRVRMNDARIIEKTVRNIKGVVAEQEKIYAIPYDGSLPYFLLNEVEKLEIENMLIFTSTSSQFKTVVERNLTEETVQKLKKATLLHRNKKAQRFNLEKFVDMIEEVAMQENYGNLLKITTKPKDNKKYIFLMSVNTPIENLFENRAFMNLDVEMAVKIAYDGNESTYIIPFCLSQV